MTPVALSALTQSARALAFAADADCYIEESGRSDARTVFIDRDDGYFLKLGAPGTLKSAARMQEYFASHALAPKLVWYETGEADLMLTMRAQGLSAITPALLRAPGKLVPALARAARALHDMPAEDCPVRGGVDRLVHDFEAAYARGDEMCAHVAEYAHIASRDEAAREVRAQAKYLAQSTITHGDFCLPNVMFEQFRFTAFIDLGAACLGNRHHDLFWTLWSMQYNLKTDEWRDAFISEYGRSLVNEDEMRICACLSAL